VAYKLSALLLNRLEIPFGVREYLFGDDSESDALIYGLYADMIAGRLRGEELDATLAMHRVDARSRRYIVDLVSQMPEQDLVVAIFIHLERQTPPDHFNAWGCRLFACGDSFHLGVHLQRMALISWPAFGELARSLAEEHAFHWADLKHRVEALSQCGVVDGSWLRECAEQIPEMGLIVEASTPEKRKAQKTDMNSSDLSNGRFVTPVTHRASDLT